MQNFDGRSWNIGDAPVLQDEYNAREMPALIAGLSSHNSIYNLPLLVEIEINRTGDATPNITYRPYYSAGDKEHDVLNGTERFFYVDGSVQELVNELALPIIIVETDFENYMITDSFESAGDLEVVITLRGSGDVETVIVRDIRLIDLLDSIFWMDPHWTSLEIVADLLDIPTEIITGMEMRYPDAWSSNFDLSHYTEQLQRTGIYTGIDFSTAQGLRRLAREAGIDPNAERTEIADAVARYIISSGTYTLNPGTIPPDEDFALYFLETLQEGYCVHFATAATLMLRSLGVPARFTSGYVTTVAPGQVDRTVVLTDANAHAWVEVYYEDVGWLYLEVTPSAGNTYVPPPRPHSPETVTPTPTPTPEPTPQTPDTTNTPPPNELPPEDTNGNGSSGAGDSANAQNILPITMSERILLGIAIFVFVFVAALLLRRNIAKKRRAKQFERTSTNESAILAWHYIKKLSKREVVPPSNIEKLVLKARFSQHRLDEEERTEVVKYAKSLAYELYSGKGDFARLWFKYIRALY